LAPIPGRARFPFFFFRIKKNQSGPRCPIWPRERNLPRRGPAPPPSDLAQHRAAPPHASAVGPYHRPVFARQRFFAEPRPAQGEIPSWEVPRATPAKSFRKSAREQGIDAVPPFRPLRPQEARPLGCVASWRAGESFHPPPKTMEHGRRSGFFSRSKAGLPRVKPKQRPPAFFFCGFGAALRQNIRPPRAD